MVKRVSSAVHHREAIGNYIRSQDEKQKSYRYQNDLVAGLARQQGLHSENKQRRNISLAMLKLFSLLSSIRSDNSSNFIKKRQSIFDADLNYSCRNLSVTTCQTSNTVINLCSGTVRNELDHLGKFTEVNYTDYFSGTYKHALVSRETSNAGRVLEQIAERLRGIRLFISRYDPFVFPVVGASYSDKEYNNTHKDNLNLSIVNLDDLNMKLYLAESNSTVNVAYQHIQRTDLPKINEYYSLYRKKHPSLTELARGKLKGEIYKLYKLDVNPDHLCFMQFGNVMYDSHEKIHFPPARLNRTLTECLFYNFGGSIQNNMQDMDSMCGIYADCSLKKKEYHASDEIKIKPTEFINLVWDIDFYSFAKSKISEKYENNDDQINKLIIDFILDVSVSDLDAEYKENILKCVLGLGSSNFNISIFGINNYHSSNAFLFKNPSDGSVVIYFPMSYFKFKKFDNDEDMHSWIASVSKDELNIKMIASHFTLEEKQDGFIKDGVVTILKKIVQHRDEHELIDMHKNNIPIESFFKVFSINMKNKELSDLDFFVKSDAEVKRDMWEDMIDASNILPNPVSPFLSLGMHAVHIMGADTLEEKKIEWGKMRNDIINIISFILIDKVSGKNNFEEYVPANAIEEITNTKYDVIEENNIANQRAEPCFRFARGIVAGKPCVPVNDINDDYYEIIHPLNGNDGAIGLKLPQLRNPPEWYKKENVLKKDVSAEGIVFINPLEPKRIIKFYKKENSEVKAENNALIFKKLYSSESVNVLELKDELGRVFTAVDMPKLSGLTLADIRNENDIVKAMALARVFIKEDRVAKLIATLQDLNINIKDFNIGNVIFDPSSKSLKLIDFDYANANYIVTDSHYKTMYESLYIKIKQDFLAIKWKGNSDKKTFLFNRAIMRMNKRFTTLIMDKKTPRISGFRESIEKYNRETQIYASWALKRWVEKNMLKSDVNGLSFPDDMGLRQDRYSNNYIKINKGFFKVQKNGDNFFMENSIGDKLFLKYKNALFYPDNIVTYGGALSSSVEQEYLTRAINSDAGLKLKRDLVLNESWTLSTVKLKGKNVINKKEVGSRIDVTFTLHYKKVSKKFIDMNNLQWNENISFKRNNNKWVFDTDMFNHNPHSKVFFPWANRYIEAYHYAKASDKKIFNGNVKIYKSDFGMISPDEIKYSPSKSEAIKNVKDYLSKHGGIIEITLTDFPRLIRSHHTTNAERVVGFNVAFDNKSVLKFYQGISLPTENSGTVFISISDDIKLALGAANIPPPKRVSEPRAKRSL